MLNKERYSDQSLKEKISEILAKNELGHVKESTLAYLTEELKIYHQELIYQNEELMRIRDDLEESEKNYIEIFNNAPIGYVILDNLGIIKKANKTFLAMIGLEKNKVIDVLFSNFISAESQDEYYFHFRELKKSLTTQNCTLSLSQNSKMLNSIFYDPTNEIDEKKLYVNLISNAYIEEHVSYIRISIVDITEKRKADEEIKKLNETLEKKVQERTEELENANKDLESFAYSISHDLRAPLRHIDGFSRILKNHTLEKNLEAEHFFKKIFDAITRMSDMIDGLLKFSRLGRKVIDKKNVDLNILIKDVINEYKTETEHRNIEYKIGQLPIVQGDYTLLRVVFDNLISNAIKFTSKKEFAVIEINQCKNTIKDCTMYIKDNGAGFDMNYENKLFRVFQRLHSESEFEGTGIGLANIRQIIQKHGGSIRVESKVNKGATFFLYL